MKLQLNKENSIEVSFWSVFKFFALSQLLFIGVYILFLVIVVIGIANLSPY